jgi:hypothetical protein
VNVYEKRQREWLADSFSILSKFSLVRVVANATFLLWMSTE